ncbi:hypothetical protein Cal6303_1116 [Calothrix sp. PCC 6303]|nr:hypothetical protein Cal6303_1116 [Calothrix sp. PCC 6303]
MHRIFYLVTLILPAIILSIGSSNFNQVNLFINSFIDPNSAESLKNQVQSPTYLNPYLTAARDDRMEDCLRSGNCKD